jgi:tetratricopeptide (TPR) repeat protein
MDAPAASKGSDPESLFLVASMEDVPCETVVGSWIKPPSAHRGLANMHFRSAQKLLVEGRSDAAHAELCKSALLNASGPGSELLAQYSLGARSTLQAERWIREVLKVQPESPVARELLGDILHQQGRLDEALTTWLDTLNVAAEDMAKRKAVARVWIGHSRTALAATDYPRAERSLRRALAFDPHSVEGASLMALVFRRRKNDDRADAWDAEAARLRGAR